MKHHQVPVPAMGGTGDFVSVQKTGQKRVGVGQDRWRATGTAVYAGDVNAVMNILEVKLLTNVVPDSSAVENGSREHLEASAAVELPAIEEIHSRAETMTSLLKGILELRPATHWGINE